MLFLLPQVCQMPTANLSALICATMNSVPIGRAWQMIAADKLEVPVPMQKQQPLINGGARLLDKAVSRSHSPSKSKQLFTSQKNGLYSSTSVGNVHVFQYTDIIHSKSNSIQSIVSFFSTNH